MTRTALGEQVVWDCLLRALQQQLLQQGMTCQLPFRTRTRRISFLQFVPRVFWTQALVSMFRFLEAQA